MGPFSAGPLPEGDRVMNRYETFVVRVWIEDDGTDLNHGEIRHVSSGMGVRFRELREVLKFIQRFSASRASQGSQTKQADG